MQATVQQVEEKLNPALDWFRYADGCYLLYTTTPIKTWATRLHPLVTYVLILEIDPEGYWGFMPKNLWSWLKEKKEKLTGES